MNTFLSPSRVSALLGVTPQPMHPTARARARRARGEYTDQDGQLLRRLIRQGYSQVGAAAKLGIPRGSVSYVLSITRKGKP